MKTALVIAKSVIFELMVNWKHARINVLFSNTNYFLCVLSMHKNNKLIHVVSNVSHSAFSPSNVKHLNDPLKTKILHTKVSIFNFFLNIIVTYKFI